MVVLFKHQFMLILLAAFAPFVGLILRGMVWGNDSFAFLAVSSGQMQYAQHLGSPQWFINFLYLLNGNILLIGLVMFFLYLFALWGLWIFGKTFFIEKSWLGITKDTSWKFVFVVASISPLFFMEALRFENDFFGWTLAFVVLGLFSLAIRYKTIVPSAISVFLGVILGVFSVIMWFPSIFILLVVFFLLPISSKYKNIGVFGLFAIFFIIYFQYVLGSLNILTSIELVVAEEIPFVGLIFVFHIIHFVKRVPKELLLYSILVLGVGLLKAKFIFLVIPFLVLGLMKKENEEGLIVRGDRIPLIPICCLCLIGLTFMSPFLFPTQNDLIEIKEAIVLADDLNLPFYNSWGEGWIVSYLGKETDYKIGHPELDDLWQDFNHPYVVYTNEEDLNGCDQRNSKTYVC